MEVLRVENVQAENTPLARRHIYVCVYIYIYIYIYAYLDLDIKITPKLPATVLNKLV